MIEVVHNRLTYSDVEVEAVARTLRSGYWASGLRVTELERALAKLGSVKHAVGVASGLAALRLVLKGLGVKPGDRVLVPAYSCVALANATLACGATPVPVDITPQDWNFSLAEGQKMIAEYHPKAAIVVHTFGAPVPIEQMLDWGIPIVEDCAHAFGIHVNEIPLGGRAHAAILSFYATKLMGAGEGGAVLTNSAELAQFVRTWKDYTDKPPNGTRLNDKMTDLEATLALCQLERLNDMIAARQKLAERYCELLAPEADRNGCFRLPNDLQPRIWYRYAVEMLGVPAKAVVEQLEQYGVQAAQPVTDWRPQNSPSSPLADTAYDHIVSLPLYPTLTTEEQDKVVQALLQVCQDT